MQRGHLFAGAATRFGMPGRVARERMAAVFGMFGLAVLAADIVADRWLDAPLVAAVGLGTAGDAGRATRPGAPDGLALGTRETLAGGYLGVTYTQPSSVTIKNPGRTDLTVGGVDWIGMPFKSPIYYGARVTNWPGLARFGTMLDFTHAKAIAPFDDDVTLTGTHEGKPLPGQAKVGEVFKHFEFSHGHNMLTVNALTRLGFFPVQPYVGAGAGISLPHTEIAFRTENGRTYEYQYAGFTGQALAGLEVRLGRASVFLEYKLSYSPYDVPLSNVVNGSWLFVDVWRQFRAWMARETPPGGRLTTPLLTNHLIGGAMVRVSGVRTVTP